MNSGGSVHLPGAVKPRGLVPYAALLNEVRLAISVYLLLVDSFYLLPELPILSRRAASATLRRCSCVASK